MSLCEIVEIIEKSDRLAFQCQIPAGGSGRGRGMATQNKRVSYYYDPDIGNFYYGQVSDGVTTRRHTPHEGAAPHTRERERALVPWFLFPPYLFLFVFLCVLVCLLL